MAYLKGGFARHVGARLCFEITWGVSCKAPNLYLNLYSYVADIGLVLRDEFSRHRVESTQQMSAER